MSREIILWLLELRCRITGHQWGRHLVDEWGIDYGPACSKCRRFKAYYERRDR